MQTTTTNHYGHNVDVTGWPFYCTDCDAPINGYITDELVNDQDVEISHREYLLGQYSTNELQAELERRGYVNGVLINPSLDEDDE